MATPSSQKLKKSPTNNPSKSKSDDSNLPPKPYTEYTIFFRLERAYILQRSGIIDEETLAVIDPTHNDPLEFPRPPKYTTLVLPPYWYSSSHKAAIEKKRKHRKREGRMDLKTLSKTISANWRNCDSAVIEYCRGLSRAESEKYNLAVEAALARQEEEQASLNAATTNNGGNGIHNSGNTNGIMGGAAAQLQGGSSSGCGRPIPDGALSLQALQDRMSNGSNHSNNNHSFSRQSSTHSALDMSNHSMNNLMNNMNMNQMNANFLKVKGYGGALPEQGMNNNQQQQQDLMRLFQLQQLQNAHNQQLQNNTQNAPNQVGGGGQFNISPNSVTSGCTPFSSSNNNNMSTTNHVASNNNISAMNNNTMAAQQVQVVSSSRNNNGLTTREGPHSAAAALNSNSSSSTTTTGRDGLLNGPMPKNKRKFLRRASAPAEYTGHDILALDRLRQLNVTGMNNDNVTMMNNMRNCSSSHTSGGTMNNNNTNSPSSMMGISEYAGSDSCNHQAPLKKPMRRRATVECSGYGAPTPQDMASLKKGAWNKLNRRLSGSEHGLSASFTAELGGSTVRGSELRGSFTCVPDWKQEDANTLLGILNQDDPLNVEGQSHQQQGEANHNNTAGSNTIMRGYGNGVDAMLAAFEQEEGDFPSLDMAMGRGDGEGLPQQWGQQQQQQQSHQQQQQHQPPPMNNGLCNFIH